MNEKKKPHILPALIVFIIMAMISGIYALVFLMQHTPDKNRIIEGVYVDGINISGMTAEEAQAAIEQYTNGKSARTLTVDVNGKKVRTTLDELEFHAEENDTVEKAMSLGKTGSFLENYREVNRIKEEHVNYTLSYTYSEKKVKKFVKKKCGKNVKKAKNATVKMENGEFKYTKSRDGISVDVDATIDVIKSAVEQTLEGDIEVEAILIVEKPEITYEQVKKCKDKIGSFSTSFSAGNVSRSKNLANAARLISGSVVYPGETFSVHDTISPMTEENGYYAAPSYNNGKVEDSIGGGVCQVSTTLYNAILRAELEIVQRAPHSMVVSYVKPSMDAAIAGDYKDFKFRNNTDVPVLIQGWTDSGQLYFNVYGEETRDPDRKVEFVSEVLKKTEPGEDKVVLDPTKPPSYEHVEQSAHIGYEAVLWKVVTENGKTTKKQINSSSYKAVPRTVTKGSGKEEPKATKKPKSTDKPKATEKPKETKKPAKETD
ncbi:MAG: VanW family protein [Eubacterium sp.]|nr:VanW family protein [Eubacterium sp.]